MANFIRQEKNRKSRNVFTFVECWNDITGLENFLQLLLVNKSPLIGEIDFSGLRPVLELEHFDFPYFTHFYLQMVYFLQKSGVTLITPLSEDTKALAISSLLQREWYVRETK